MNSLSHLIDTHCHIHDGEFYDAEACEKAYQESVKNGVAMICVGTDLRSSRQALEDLEIFRLLLDAGADPS